MERPQYATQNSNRVGGILVGSHVFEHNKAAMHHQLPHLHQDALNAKLDALNARNSIETLGFSQQSHEPTHVDLFVRSAVAREQKLNKINNLRAAPPLPSYSTLSRVQ